MLKKEKWSIEKLCIIALLVAIEVVLARFVSINTMGIRIGFGFIPVMLAAYIYGPISAGTTSALADLIGALLFPTGPYHPGFTVMAFCSGAVFGLLLDMDSPNNFWYWMKAILAILMHCIVFGLVVNTIWVSQLYGSKTYGGWFLYRLSEYAVMVPVQIIMTPLVKELAKKLRRAQ